MKAEPLVTVIVPTYNRQDTILLSLQSVLNQTYKNTEIIIIDDGSVDDTEAVLMPYMDRIRYIRQHNQGQAAARNAGLINASGSLVASLDSDDIWHEDFLSKCVHQMESEGLDFVFTNWNQQNKDGTWVNSFSRYFFLEDYIKEAKGANWVNIEYKSLRKLYLKHCPSPSSSFLMRRENIGTGWNVDMHVADDWCLLLDVILSRPRKVAFTTEILWQKGVNDINICDGRNVVELVKLLYIEDTKNLMMRFKKLVDPSEYQIFQGVYIENLIKLGSYHILRERKMITGLNLWREAAFYAPGMALKGLWSIFLRKTMKSVGIVQQGA